MLHVVTVATESAYYLPYLQKTCSQFGSKLEILGYGEKWNGYTFKFEKMVDFLRSIPLDDIVCFIDGYDVICVRDLSALIPTFLYIRDRERCQIVIAQDGGIIPDAVSSIYFGKCKNTFINSGTYIGFAGDILTTLTDAHHMNPNEKDDQRLITEYCRLHPKKFYIDKHNEVFLAYAWPLSEARISGNPFFVHAPGCGYMSNLLENMGYTVDPNIKKDLRRYFFRKGGEHASVFLQRYVIWVLLFIMIIAILMNK